jgi:hemerythrin
MEEAGYRYLKVHKRVHAIFTKKVEAYVKRFESDEMIAEELLSTLRLWVMNHIRNDDAHYVSVVKAIVGEEKKKGWLAGTLKKFFG